MCQLATLPPTPGLAECRLAAVAASSVGSERDGNAGVDGEVVGVAVTVASGVNAGGDGAGQVEHAPGSGLPSSLFIAFYALLALCTTQII